MITKDILIREATRDDMAGLITLLEQAGLSSHAVLVDGTRYWVIEQASGPIIGTIGLELGQGTALLRSAAVSPAYQDQGIGTQLVLHVFREAARAGLQRIYLFSTDAGAYWQRHHFREVPVPELVRMLPSAPQVKYYESMGWLPTEVAWRRDLDEASMLQ